MRSLYLLGVPSGFSEPNSLNLSKCPSRVLRATARFLKELVLL